MLVPSLHIPEDPTRPWSVARAAAYGAGIGALAALFKAFGPLHQAGSDATKLFQIAAAVLAFAVLCAGAAALRNWIARRFVWRE